MCKMNWREQNSYQCLKFEVCMEAYSEENHNVHRFNETIKSYCVIYFMVRLFLKESLQTWGISKLVTITM